MTELPELDRLDLWASMSDKELLRHCSAGAMESLKRAAEEVGVELELQNVTTPERFVAQVRNVWNLKQKGARELGVIIVEAAKLKDLGKLEQAARVYRRFLETCRAPFYREIALNELGSVEI